MTEAPFPPVRRVGILGAGVMGRSIAVANLQRGVAVRIYDPSEDAVRGAAKVVTERFPPVESELEFAESPAALADCDLVLEAVVENQSVKRRILSATSELLAPATLLASNTSSLSISTLGEKVTLPERFCGLHFCHPVLERPLVEVVRGARTGDDTIRRAAAYVEQIGKRPLITADVPGFAVNGLLLPYLDAAIDLVRGRVDWRWLETVAMKAGMPDGPLTRIDDIGVDVILRAAAAFHRGNPTVPEKSEVLLALYQAGRLGRKTGAGFFRYDSPVGPAEFDYAAPALIEPYLTEPYLTEPFACTEPELVHRLFDPLIATAHALVDRGVIRSLDEARLALSDGLGCGLPIAELRI